MMRLVRFIVRMLGEPGRRWRRREDERLRQDDLYASTANRDALLDAERDDVRNR
jgi:hypothetical protein